MAVRLPKLCRNPISDHTYPYQGGGKGSVVPLTLHTDPLLKISSPGSKTRGIRSEPRYYLYKRLCGRIDSNLYLAIRISPDAIG